LIYELYYWPRTQGRCPRVGPRRRVAGPAELWDRYLLGTKVSYADLSLFQIVAGLCYAFPNTMALGKRKYRHLFALHARIQEP